MNAEVRQMKTAAEAALVETFAAAKTRLPGLRELRETAFQQFDTKGLPHRRVEEWKYTDLRALMRDAKPLAAAPDAQAKARAREAGQVIGDFDCRRLIFVDGMFAPELSDMSPEPGLHIGSMAEALASGDALVTKHVGQVVKTDDAAVALNTALMNDGVVIRVDAGTALSKPIYLLFANTGAQPVSIFTRSLVMIGADAKAMIVESHEGSAEDQVSAGLDMIVGDGAHVDHVKLATGAIGAVHVSTLMASIGAKVRFNDFTFVTGGNVMRNQLFLRFDGADTVANIGGATMLKGRQHADTTLVIEHFKRGCQSRELFKSVLDGESRGVFQGRIAVEAEAQKTDAKMSAHALLLSETAEVNAKPELEIFADDVQCGHGATAGALDDNLLFYLKARGIPEKEAEALMVKAFVGEAVETVEHAGLREILMSVVDNWLEARG
jgi:Fe-S cluster assembly protein SufD